MQKTSDGIVEDDLKSIVGRLLSYDGISDGWYVGSCAKIDDSSEGYTVTSKVGFRVGFCRNVL